METMSLQILLRSEFLWIIDQSGLSQDNGYDPDVNAKQFWIDKTQIKGEDCLIFMDNGGGLNYEMMLKLLRYGHSL